MPARSGRRSRCGAATYRRSRPWHMEKSWRGSPSAERDNRPRMPKPASGDTHPGQPAPTGLAPALDRGLRRPDPALGLIETLAVQDRQPVALELHLARLAASAAEVLGIAVPG